MALPQPLGLVPTEVAFLCEMELVTVVPRQRLDSIDLLGVCSATDINHSFFISLPSLLGSCPSGRRIRIQAMPRQPFQQKP
jgi:hypothetical protein